MPIKPRQRTATSHGTTSANVKPGHSVRPLYSAGPALPRRSRSVLVSLLILLLTVCALVVWWLRVGEDGQRERDGTSRLVNWLAKQFQIRDDGHSRNAQIDLWLAQVLVASPRPDWDIAPNERDSDGNLVAKPVLTAADLAVLRDPQNQDRAAMWEAYNKILSIDPTDVRAATWIRNAGNSLTVEIQIKDLPVGAVAEIAALKKKADANGKFAGVPIGSHKIAVSKPGYEPAEIDLMVKDAAPPAPLKVALMRQKGALEIGKIPPGVTPRVTMKTSDAGSKAEEDARYDASSLTSLPTGEYEVTFSSQEFGKIGMPAAVTVKVGDRKVVPAPEFSMGTLNTNPSGAKVTMKNPVSGKSPDLGKTPISLDDLGPGKHTLSITLEGYLSRDVEVTLPQKQSDDPIILIKPVYTGTITARENSKDTWNATIAFNPGKNPNGTYYVHTINGNIVTDLEKGAWTGPGTGNAISAATSAKPKEMPQGFVYTPGSFTLTFSDDGKTATYETRYQDPKTKKTKTCTGLLKGQDSLELAREPVTKLQSR